VAIGLLGADPNARVTPMPAHGPLATHIGTAAGLECEFAVRAAQLAPCLGITRHAQPLPERSAETYTAHTTAKPAVQSNTVYPTPCTACTFDPLGLGVG
jgi:hypothetical protein